MDRPRPRWRSVLVLICASLVAGVASAAAQTQIGDLDQLPLEQGCISEPAADGCAAGRALDFADGVTVSPDGKNAYVASREGNAVAIFDRDAASGALTQKAGTAGCVSDDGSGGSCADGRALAWATNVAISPDGESAYVVSSLSDATSVFDRDPETGALTEKAGTAGCIKVDGTEGCAVGRGGGGSGAEDVAVSPDGKNVYSTGHGGIQVFDRDAAGALTQKPGAAGCIADGTNEEFDGCNVQGRAMGSTRSVTLSPDGQNLYVASNSINWLAIFDRNPDGTLTQKMGTAGCYSDTAQGGDPSCTSYREGDFFSEALSVAVSADGKNAYVATGHNASIVIFDRDPATGTLTPKEGTAGCVSEIASNCGPARAITNASDLDVSPDGQSVYAASNFTGNEVANFDRNPATGELSQAPDVTGCVSSSGDDLTCARGRGIVAAQSVVISPKGENVYIAASGSDAVATFSREAPPPPPSVSIDDVALAEGDVGTTAFTFTATLSEAAPASGVTVDYATADGSATAGDDYTSASGALSFAAGQTEQTVTIDVSGDADGEPDEDFLVNLFNAQGATIADSQGVGTIQNDDAPPGPPELTVFKQVVNDDGGTRVPGDFSLHVKEADVDVAGSPQPGDDEGTTYTLEADKSYVVSEDPVAGYEATFTGECDADGSITLAAGDNKTCTVTNDDVAPTLTVVKHVVNDHGGAAVAGDWNMHIETGLPLADVPGSPFPGSESGTATSVDAGSYVVSESDGPAGYTAAISGDCAADGSITLALGDDKTCTVTNDDDEPPAPATLRVVKHVVNDDGGTAAAGAWNLHIRAGSPLTDVAGSPFPGSEAGTTRTLDAGSYTVAESGGLGGYTGSISGDCAADGTVTLAPGDSKTCTITNDDVAQPPPPPGTDLELSKSASDTTPGLGDDFTYSLTVFNRGPGTAAAVVVTDDLPDGLRLRSAPGGCGAGVVCALGDLPAGASRTVALTVEARLGCDFVGTSGDDSDWAIGSTRKRDLICGGAGGDRLSGNAGADRLYGFAPPGVVPKRISNRAAVSSTTSDPEPGGNAAEVTVRVVGGNDRNDTIFGGAGPDELHGQGGADDLYGDAGADELHGGVSNDLLSGGRGRDLLEGGAGRDTIRCGAGRDRVTADLRDLVAGDCEHVVRRR